MMTQTPNFYFSKSDVADFLNKETTRRQSNKVLHAHPSPQLWKKTTSQQVEAQLEKRLSKNSQLNRQTNFYVGIPFCLPTSPGHCGFCLFPTQDYRGNDAMNLYLEKLSEEAALYAPYYQNDQLASIYIGGGTPNLMRPQQYGKVMQIIDHLYQGIPKDIEISLEGIPQLYNKEKLHAIKAAGINRISMGVQQLNDKLIQHSGRKQTKKQVFDTLETCQALDINCNIDLIYGWPEQTIDNMLEDLEAIIDAGVNHITHYELNIAGRSNFATRRKHLLPSIEDNINYYQIACDFLISKGYQQRTIYDWEKSSDTDNTLLYERNLRQFAYKDNDNITHCQDLCGIGYAALSFQFQQQNNQLECHTYANSRNLEDYYKQLEQGQFPIERSFHRTAIDTQLCWLFQSIQSLEINIDGYKKLFNQSLIKDYQTAWQEFSERDWIRIKSNNIELTRKGQYFSPIMQSCLAAPRNIDIRKSSSSNEANSIQCVELS